MQRLFARLQLSERAAVPTTELQRSVGRTGAEAIVQQLMTQLQEKEALLAAGAGLRGGRATATRSSLLLFSSGDVSSRVAIV